MASRTKTTLTLACRATWPPRDGAGAGAAAGRGAGAGTPSRAAAPMTPRDERLHRMRTSRPEAPRRDAPTRRLPARAKPGRPRTKALDRGRLGTHDGPLQTWGPRARPARGRGRHRTRPLPPPRARPQASIMSSGGVDVTAGASVHRALSVSGGNGHRLEARAEPGHVRHHGPRDRPHEPASRGAWTCSCRARACCCSCATGWAARPRATSPRASRRTPSRASCAPPRTRSRASRRTTLKRAVEEANGAILAEATAHPEERGMGTTCTAAVCSPEGLSVAQVGDSRAYLFRERRLLRLTRDQTIAARLIDEGVLEPSQLANFPFRHVLAQALGTEGNVQPVMTDHDLRENDRVLICSDGLHGPVDERTIATILARRARRRGGHARPHRRRARGRRPRQRHRRRRRLRPPRPRASARLGVAGLTASPRRSRTVRTVGCGSRQSPRTDRHSADADRARARSPRSGGTRAGLLAAAARESACAPP